MITNKIRSFKRSDKTHEPAVNRIELAKITNVAQRTLSRWMKEDGAPKSFKLDGSMLFKKSEAVLWVENRKKSKATHLRREIVSKSESLAAVTAQRDDLLAVLIRCALINGFREFNDYLPTIRAAIAKCEVKNG